MCITSVASTAACEAAGGTIGEGGHAGGRQEAHAGPQAAPHAGLQVRQAGPGCDRQGCRRRGEAARTSGKRSARSMSESSCGSLGWSTRKK